MGSINNRNGKLRLDFRYLGVRCREQTDLTDTAANRRKLEKLLATIDSDIRLQCFVYRDYFPGSNRAKYFAQLDNQAAKRKEEMVHHYKAAHTKLNKCENITLGEFADEWFDENSLRWKQSYRETLTFIINSYIKPEFGRWPLDAITRADLLKFRAQLGKPQNGKKLSNDFINHVMTPLRIILSEAGDRYEFRTPFENIKPLRIEKPEVNPFSLQEVFYFLDNVRADFKHYYAMRFFTGMRTSEIDGLKWKYVNFDTRTITIRDTIVNGRPETAKTVGSARDIQMSSIVYDALVAQKEITMGKSDYVFCTNAGTPLDHRNIRMRIWQPTLKRLGLAYRRPYETRHTAATLWLAAGEAPEWIARQMGHTTTKMLFEVYSRFVPNLTRQDGSAFENLLNQTKKRDD